MRKIEKSPNVPKSLQDAPVPNSKDEVKESIFKAEDVRKQLMEDQHNKCAYCEWMITKAYNDVDHYRPKSMYYWLGHSWDNLLYSCPTCNRSNKNDRFPLEDETTRCTTAYDNIEQEKPLLINPYIDNPLNHIEFTKDKNTNNPTGIVKGIDEKGNTTIDILKLNRPELVNERKKCYEKYRNEIVKRKIGETKCCQDIVDLCNKSIAEMKSLDTPFSGILTSLND